ncbi:MAG: tetratricopeptide repeat protein [bacterium]|nr:tetratricopeptide repeat protein [bacterium]
MPRPTAGRGLVSPTRANPRATPRGIVTPRVTPAPRLVPRTRVGGSIARGLGRRVGATSRLWGSRFGAVAGGWWDPCWNTGWGIGWGNGFNRGLWSLNGGRGCWGFGVDLWHPWFAATAWNWGLGYRNCWWNNVSAPVWNDFWWYPNSTYCPNFLYVPSSTTVIVESEPAIVEVPADDPVAADPIVDVPVPAPAVSPEDRAAADLATKYVELGDFYFKAGRFEDAADAYARARSYAPNDAQLHFVLADAAFASGDYHFAAFLIAEGLRLDPALAGVKVDKREFYGDRKLFDQHMVALDKYLADKKYDASAHLVRGYNLYFSANSTAAIAAFRRVLEIAPDHRAARAFLAALEPKRAESEPGGSGDSETVIRAGSRAIVR